MRIAARGCVALADGSFWLYEYDKLGQVKSGKKYWSDWTPVAGQQFEYGFDDIGNRTGTKVGGDASGANLRSASYTANKLNQYSSRTVPGYVDVTGVALAGSTVTVNGPTPPVYRRTEYFRKELTAANTSLPVWQSVSVAATGETTVNGNVFVPQTPESYTYDLDGNVTADGRWTYTWDAENRLVKMVKNSPTIDLATAPTGASFQKLGFVYDALGRRIAKSYYTLSTDTTPFLTYRFLYDGWNLLAIVNAQSSLLASFTWGSDLSGSLQGAGGVGGLLITRDAALGTVNCAGYDGNGNVMALVNAADGKVNAQYEYGPFGEVLRATGPMARANPFRFSTKYQDDESDLLYYGYRYYNASTGRWPNRDPIGELGAINLYGFVHNNPINTVDLHGLSALGDAWEALKWLYKGPCGAAVGGIASKIYFKSQADTRYAHCMVSCKIGKWCGKDTAAAAGVAKEFYDLITCAYQGLRTGKWDSPQCYSAFQPSDFKDNAQGINCPKDKNCQDQCKDLKGAPEADPGPFYKINEKDVTIIIF